MAASYSPPVRGRAIAAWCDAAWKSAGSDRQDPFRARAVRHDAIHDSVQRRHSAACDGDAIDRTVWNESGAGSAKGCCGGNECLGLPVDIAKLGGGSKHVADL